MTDQEPKSLIEKITGAVKGKIFIDLTRNGDQLIELGLIDKERAYTIVNLEFNDFHERYEIELEYASGYKTTSTIKYHSEDRPATPSEIREYNSTLEARK